MSTKMVTRNTRCVWVRLKDCDGLERQPTFVNVQSDEYLDDVIKACLAVSKVNIAPNLVKVFSADDSTDPIETVIPVDDLIRSNRGTISSPLLLQCPQWKSVTAYPSRKQKKSYVPQRKNFKIKLILLGKSSVGKSCLLLRFTTGQFIAKTVTTLPGRNCSISTVEVDGTYVDLEIWDTAGQERFAYMAPLYYRRAQAAIVVYDITDKDTFKDAKSWVNKLREERPSTLIALAGNKTDLAAERQVKFEHAQAYAEENGLLFMETSAKTGRNVETIFHAIAYKIPKYDPTQQPTEVNGHSQEFSITEAQQQGRNRCQC